MLQWVNKIYRFLVTSGCLLSGKVRWAVQISSFWGTFEVFYRTEWTKVIAMNLKIKLKYFQIQKGILQAGRAEKEDEKIGVICIVFMFSSWVLILILTKKGHFFNFVLTSAKKYKYVKAYEISRSVLSGNVIVYYSVT